VAHRGGEDTRRRRAHERFDESARLLFENRIEIAALIVDRAIIKIAHLADGLGQSAERRNLGPARVLLHPDALEVWIAIDIGARLPLPASPEPGQSSLKVKKE